MKVIKHTFCSKIPPWPFYQYWYKQYTVMLCPSRKNPPIKTGEIIFKVTNTFISYNMGIKELLYMPRIGKKVKEFKANNHSNAPPPTSHTSQIHPKLNLSFCIECFKYELKVKATACFTVFYHFLTSWMC